MEGKEWRRISSRFSTTICLIVAAAQSVSAQSVTDPRCGAPFGSFPDVSHCDRYISCWAGRGFSQRCGVNMVFNPITRACQGGVSCLGASVGTPDSGQRLRLLGGRGPWEGQLQVRYSGSWHFVDSRGWSTDLGQMVCAQLGFIGYETGQNVVTPGQGRSQVVQLGCPGSARTITSCSRISCTSCGINTRVISVKCSTARTSLCPSSSVIEQRSWQRWGKSCYLRLDNYRASRDSARSMCRQHGGELVAVATKEEHEYLSELLSGSAEDLEFYTDGAGLAVGGLKLWSWESSRDNLRHSRWWPGWNATRSLSIAPTPNNTPSCLVLKKSYPLPSSGSSESSYDSGFFYFNDADCSKARPFVCEAPLGDVGCYEGDGTSYSGAADVSRSGRPCLKWSDPRVNSLQGRASRARNFDLGLLGAHNQCRNPDGSPSPWCYVDAERTETCDIPRCNRVTGGTPSPGLTPRTSTLLRPLQNGGGSSFTTIASTNTTTRATTTTTFSTTTTKLSTTTAKVRCGTGEHLCEAGSKCVTSQQMCDGERNCPRGDDEHLCKRFLQEFDARAGMSLLTLSVVEIIRREDSGVCAKLCINNHRCKGFIYNTFSKQCTLSRLDIASSGLVTSNSETFYELRSRRSSCGSRHKCGNERCVSRSQVCDGTDNCGDNSDELQCRSHIKYETRLVGGAGRHEGNVQIKVDGEWGWICDDGFGFEAADLLCRDLGYTGALTFTRNNHFSDNDSRWKRSNPKFWMDKVSCTGRESSFFDCGSSGLGVHDCGPTELAGVVCRTGTAVCSQDEFQCGTGGLLSCIPRNQVCDGSSDCFNGSDEDADLCDDVGVTKLVATTRNLEDTVAGTVYVKHKGQWGTVCDDAFDERHAKVICNSLGYERGWAVPYPRAFFGSGRGNIWIDEPGCRGHEKWIGECPRLVWSVTDCDHSEDVGVLCSDKLQVRLAGGPSKSSGRVEVKLSGKWGTVCDDDFDDYDAKVVCRMLGYRGDAIAHKHGKYGGGSGPIWLDSLDCNGDESDIKQCKKSQPAASDCTHSEDASVSCYNSRRENVGRGLQTALPGGCGRRTGSSSSFLVDNFAKIVGGATQEPLDDPWLVSLQLKERGRLKHNCGGVIIAEDYVLTAAHCFKDHSRQSYVVRVGDYKMNSHDISQEDFTIEKLWVHDEFDTTVEFNNDIAVLKLSRKNGRGIRFGKSVQPACLPDEDASYSGLQGCSVAGWGTTSESAPAIPQNLPKSGPVNIYSMSVCTGPGRYGLFEVTSGMICAGHLDGRVDTCTGDSGGPLMCKVGDRHFLYGITSWGKGCGRQGQPGMYTKITKFLRWIHDIIV